MPASRRNSTDPCLTPENRSPKGAQAELDSEDEGLISPRGILAKHKAAPTQGAVSVVARFRPMNESEEQGMRENKQLLPFEISGKAVRDRLRDRAYTRFDEVIDFSASQEAVYDKTGKALVGHVMKGYNAGMFAYGQSGGGKTYSMLGKEGDMEGTLRGIVPRAIDELFSACSKEVQNGDVQTVCSVSFMEVYKDNLYDLLLCDEKNDSPMRLEGRENRHMRTLTSVEVENGDQTSRIVQLGQERRRYAWMPLNPVSSRSHGIIVFRVKRKYKDTSTSESSLYFVDLMGSEALVESSSGNTLDETAAVNMDLLTLGKVITALGDKKDSTLTWILRDVLGGNCMATVLVTCSPHKLQYNATQNTLEFGDQCKGVQKVLYVAEKKLSTTELLCERQLFLAQIELTEANESMVELEITAMEAEAHGARADSAEANVAAVNTRLRTLENAFDDQVSVTGALKETNEMGGLKEQRLDRIRNDLTGYLADSKKSRGLRITMFVLSRLQLARFAQSISGWKVNRELGLEAVKTNEFMFQAVRSSELQEQNAALCVLRTMINCWLQTRVLSRVAWWRTEAAVFKSKANVAAASAKAESKHLLVLAQAGNEAAVVAEELVKVKEELEGTREQAASTAEETGKLKSELQEQTEQLQQLQTAHDVAAGKVEGLEKAAAEATAQNEASFRDSNEASSQLQTELDSRGAELDAAQKQVEELKETAQQKKKQRQKKKKEMQTELDSCSVKLDATLKMVEELKEAAADEAANNEEVDKLQFELDSCSVELDSALEMVEAQDKAAKEAAAEADAKLEAAEETAVDLSEKAAKSQELTDSLEAKLEGMRSQLSEATSQAWLQEEQLEGMSQKLSEKAAADDTMVQLTLTWSSKVAELQAQLKDSESQLADVEATAGDTEAKIKAAEAKAEAAEAKAEEAEAKIEAAEAKAEAAEAEDGFTSQQLQSELDRRIEELNAAVENMAELEVTSAAATAQTEASAAEHAQAVSEMQALKAQLESMKAELSVGSASKVTELEGDLKASEVERLETQKELIELQKELSATRQAGNSPTISPMVHGTPVLTSNAVRGSAAGSDPSPTALDAAVSRGAQLQQELQAAQSDPEYSASSTNNAPAASSTNNAPAASSTNNAPAASSNNSAPGVVANTPTLSSTPSVENADLEKKDKDNGCNCAVM